MDLFNKAGREPTNEEIIVMIDEYLKNIDFINWDWVVAMQKIRRMLSTLSG